MQWFFQKSFASNDALCTLCTLFLSKNSFKNRFKKGPKRPENWFVPYRGQNLNPGYQRAVLDSWRKIAFFIHWVFSLVLHPILEFFWTNYESFFRQIIHLNPKINPTVHGEKRFLLSSFLLNGRNSNDSRNLSWSPIKCARSITIAMTTRVRPETENCPKIQTRN